MAGRVRGHSWICLAASRTRLNGRTLDLSGVRVECVREFGKVYAALALWRRLGLHSAYRTVGTPRPSPPLRLLPGSCHLVLVQVGKGHGDDLGAGVVGMQSVG